MPALTTPAPLPPLDDPSPFPSSHDHPNPYPRTSPPRPLRIPPDAVYTHTRFDSSATTRASPQSPPSSSVFGHLAPPHLYSSWQPHIQILHNNPYPLPQPPQLVHKVWILDCKSCGTFLTNRGMKAVLLLRPNVSLFSTDALPVNCSAYSSNPDALRPPPCRPSAAPFPPRTCECLTQTLCCHTCGTSVGYIIVIPCARCTSSISATNRATNGHRFVFHSGEIIASERHHIPDEPGVLSVEYFAPPPPPSSPPPLAPAYPAMLHPADLSSHRRPDSSVPLQTLHPLLASPPSSDLDYLLSPQTDSPELDLSSTLSSPDILASVPPASPQRSPRPLLQTSFSHRPVPHTLTETRVTTPEFYPRKLRAGDVLYWHHLSKHGEIPAVEEDPRARMPNRGDSLKFFER